jgi:hypothetical protein
MASRRPPDSPRTPEPLKAVPKPVEVAKPAEVIKSAEKAAAKSVEKGTAKSADTATAVPRKAAPRTRKKADAPPAPFQISDDVRRGMIAEGAYLRAERRGFVGGNERDDWLAAEAEVDALLKARHGGTQQ